MPAGAKPRDAIIPVSFSDGAPRGPKNVSRARVRREPSAIGSSRRWWSAPVGMAPRDHAGRPTARGGRVPGSGRGAGGSEERDDVGSIAEAGEVRIGPQRAGRHSAGEGEAEPAH